MTTATKPRRTRKVATKDIVPKGPCVGFEAVEHLVWVARQASSPPDVYVNLAAFDEALAADRAAEQYDLGERWARDIEYDQRESVMRGRPLKPAPKRRVPVAEVTESGTFRALDPMDPKAEKALAALRAAWAEEDGIPKDDTGPAVAPEVTPPKPRKAEGSPAGPVSPQDDPALDKAPDDRA